MSEDERLSEYWYSQGVQAFQSELFEEARECFEKAIVIDPNDTNSYLNLSLVFNKLGKEYEAILNYEKAVLIGLDNERF